MEVDGLLVINNNPIKPKVSLTEQNDTVSSWDVIKNIKKRGVTYLIVLLIIVFSAVEISLIGSRISAGNLYKPHGGLDLKLASPVMVNNCELANCTNGFTIGESVRLFYCRPRRYGNATKYTFSLNVIDNTNASTLTYNMLRKLRTALSNF